MCVFGVVFVVRYVVVWEYDCGGEGLGLDVLFGVSSCGVFDGCGGCCYNCVSGGLFRFWFYYCSVWCGLFY